ncbi:hypothetical protein NKG05_06810 [Oerskovia sp. M15]
MSRPQATVRPVLRATVVAAAALVVLGWGATLEVACAVGSAVPDDHLVHITPCPPQSTRTTAAAVGAVIVLLGLVGLLVVRRQAWAQRTGVERALFLSFVVVSVAAILGAMGSTGFVHAI